MNRDQCLGTVWVCADCYLAHHGIDDETDATPDCEPLSRIGDDVDVTAGMLSEEHADDCDPSADDYEECDCETQSFSWSQCEGCGSQLGGERHALTLWEYAVSA
jgi:hypothetical protein